MVVDPMSQSVRALCPLLPLDVAVAGHACALGAPESAAHMLKMRKATIAASERIARALARELRGLAPFCSDVLMVVCRR